MYEHHVTLFKNTLFWITLPSMALGILSWVSDIPWLGWISGGGMGVSGCLMGWVAIAHRRCF